MKKIGLLYGDEQSFPAAIIENLNKNKNIKAEAISLDVFSIEDILKYDVILDRISNKVEYYRSILKSAVLAGIKIINEPFFACADDNFFNAYLSRKMKIKTPKTLIIPSKEHPNGTNSQSFKNLKYPLNWEKAFEYVGFPAILKPNKGDSLSTEYKVYNKHEFFSAYEISGNNTMVYQEFIQYDKYFRCYTIAKTDVRIMSYNPSKPMHLRYDKSNIEIDKNLKAKIEKICQNICSAIGFDFNVVEIAVKGNDAFVIEYLNPTPNAELVYLGEDNFNWLVEKTSEFLLAQANSPKIIPESYAWSNYIK